MATFAIGLSLGFAVDLLWKKGALNDQVREGAVGKNSCGFTPQTSESRLYWAGWLHYYGRSCIREASFVGKYILLAMLIQVVMMRYLPTDWINPSLGKNNVFSIPIATFVGIPLYINNIAAPPFLKGLMDLGMAPGAAMSFMITGTIYSVPSLIAIAAIVKARLLFLYLSVGLIGGLASGYLYQAIVNI